MSANRRYKREINAARKIHNPILTKYLIDVMEYLSRVKKDNIEEAQDAVELFQTNWRRYCADYKSRKKGIAPDPNAFVDNLVKAVQV